MGERFTSLVVRPGFAATARKEGANGSGLRVAGPAKVKYLSGLLQLLSTTRLEADLCQYV